jgi:predicted short-subunit dehydrogenase-like oxidoreductase (DUF2520 family)
MKLALMGQGRLGRSILQLLRSSSIQVVTWQRGQPVPSADTYWVLVPDASIAEVAASIPIGPIVLHASGALGPDILEPHSARGTLHPAASFPGPENSLPNLDGVLAIVSGCAPALEAAKTLARLLGLRPIVLTGDPLLYHAACVLSGNFTTTLVHEAAKVAEAAGLSAEDALALSCQLAKTTLENAERLGPAAALTGPFVRGDVDIVRGHRSVLAKNRPQTLEVYDALARSTVELAKKFGHEIEEFRDLIRTSRQSSMSDDDT